MKEKAGRAQTKMGNREGGDKMPSVPCRSRWRLDRVGQQESGRYPAEIILQKSPCKILWDHLEGGVEQGGNPAG